MNENEKERGKKGLRRERRNEMMNLLPPSFSAKSQQADPNFKNHPYLTRRFFEPKKQPNTYGGYKDSKPALGEWEDPAR